MTARTLPDNPSYCFVPACDVEDEVQQIRIVFEDMAGYIPTALVVLTVDDAERLCDKLNARLGLSQPDVSRLLRGGEFLTEAPRESGVGPHAG